MNILLLHYAAPPVVGGVESVLGHQAELLAAGGHQVGVIAGRGEQFHPRVHFQSLPRVDSRHPQVLAVKAELDAGRIPEDFSSLTKAILQDLVGATRGAEVLIAHNVCSLAKNLSLTAALQKLSTRPDSPRLVLWHHDLAWTTPRYRSELHPGYPWNLLRTDWPTAVQVAVSRLRQDELAKLLQILPERIHIIPNGVDLEAFHKLEPLTRRFVADLNLLESDPLLLLPVRITTRKNIELALEIMAALCDHTRNPVLVITGPLGPHNPANTRYFERLLDLRKELRLQTRVHFLAELYSEYLPDAVISDFYHLSDGLLFPSREEGFGLPILEAALAGLPVFCTDIPPLRELGAERAHYFSPDGNPEEIATHIATWFNNSPIYQSRRSARVDYSWDRVYTQHLAPLLAGIRL